MTAQQTYPDNGELDVEAYEDWPAGMTWAEAEAEFGPLADEPAPIRADAYTASLANEHRICLKAAQFSRRDGDMAGWADFLWDAAINRRMIMVERGYLDGMAG